MRKILILLATLTAVALTGCAPIEEDPTAVQPADSKGADPSESKAAPPVKLTAKKIAYKKAEFATGGPYSCARVVVTNQTKGNVEVNPFGFEITGVDGVKRKAEVGAAQGEFDAMTLAPGEKASGTVCAETEVAPKVVTFSEGLGETARAEVG